MIDVIRNVIANRTQCCREILGKGTRPPLEGAGGGILRSGYLVAIFLFAFNNLSAQIQNTDNLYKKTLVDVLKEIQTRFKVQIKY